MAAYLQKKLFRPIIIADNIGYIHFPDKAGRSVSCDDLFITTPLTLDEDEYHYDETNKVLCYQVGQNDTRAFVVAKNLPKDKISQTVSNITEARLAIKNYFINADKIRTNSENFERQFAENLLINSNLNIGNLLEMSELDLDINQPYFVQLAYVGNAAQNFDLRLLRSYSLELVRKKNVQIIPITWGDCLMAIIPAMYKQDTLEIDPEWPRLLDSVSWKKIVDEKFNIDVSAGLGQPYMLRDLHRSYNEARIAMTLPRLMGQKGFIQRFTDLGVFSQIFTQDIKFLKNYCLRTLGILIDSNHMAETELLPTLRILLDNCHNSKLTADSLFIHVNTIQYRITKIEQLLNIDLSKMDCRVNLFTAIKVWDTLKALGFWDCDDETFPTLKPSMKKLQIQHYRAISMI
ncbi:MAG TPA: helix-turn-helix domain-containing protein [Negativicutes bacterium]